MWKLNLTALLVASSTFTIATAGVPLLARTDSNTAAACDEIAAISVSVLSYPLSTDYAAERAQYWSQEVSDLTPACIAEPVTVEAVAAIVKILLKYPTVSYAVKSGGHSPNPNFASSEGGVLVSLNKFAGATYDSANGVAYVNPGGTWHSVVAALEPSGVTVAGGRLGKPFSIWDWKLSCNAHC
jgi:FAD/FMN-containing dehydrogenase